ncbi:hypothetical protein JZM37_18320 [Acinetobacter pittii]|uniref:hypothetical protein n=1 Tax=Acinetobacter pittii TaxID=48296 RepID=UPI00197ECC87|nr:hypothetical protein [Acinetobacter pittii]MBN6526185.1 hypothetical protein [Acinetobacter pittii]
MFQIVELIINSSNLPEKFIIVVVAIAFSLITLSYIKQQDFFTDALSLYSKYINRKINKIKGYITAGNLSPEQLKRFQHRIEILTLQALLKLNNYNLDFLKFFNGYENIIHARMLYLNAYDLVLFNEEKKIIELKNPIDENQAEKLAKKADLFFGFNILASYLIFLIPVVFFPENVTPHNVFWILAIIFPLMFIQIFIGYKIAKFMKRKKHALELMKLKRIDSTEDNNFVTEDNIISIETNSNPLHINKIPNETDISLMKVEKINLNF